MRVKLTDLLDDLELDPELLPLPEAKRPTRARTERLVLQKLGISRRVRSAGRTLLAAVIAALLSLAAVAGALGLLEISRADLGVTQPEKIPEYTEYEAASQDAGARLVSSFCAGKRLIAYIDVPDVTAEMNRAYQEAMDTYGLSLWSCRAKSPSSSASTRRKMATKRQARSSPPLRFPFCPPKPYRKRRSFPFPLTSSKHPPSSGRSRSTQARSASRCKRLRWIRI